MQPISKSLSGLKWTQPPGDFPTLEDMTARLIRHPLVQDLLAKHPEINRDIIQRSLMKLYQAITEQKHCDHCRSLEDCPNLMKGHQAKLTWSGTYIETIFTACPKWVQHQEQKRREGLIKSHHIPREVLAASFQHFVRDQQRFAAFRALMEFCLKVEPGSRGRRMKGIYLYGPLGVGKSYLMAATARKLAERGISSLMVYTPDFFREIKDSVQDHSIQEKVDALKKVPVLILDDMGAETLSPWARDEILGAILQYRVSENLPTLFTSNYDYEMLEQHLSYSSKGGIETMKAKRIMERIIHYTTAYFVDGPNRRMEGE